MNKSELRQLIRQRKASCTLLERQHLSTLLCQQLLQHPRWQEAKTVLLYHALPDEVDTTLLLNSTGKQILLPVVIGDNLELRIYTGEMQEGAFHIMEPVGAVFTAYNEIDLAIIPGMAFDAEGHRLGRGKGYYDRLLPHLPHAYRLGLCFPFQLLEEVPAEPHDILMHEVLHHQGV